MFSTILYFRIDILTKFTHIFSHRALHIMLYPTIWMIVGQVPIMLAVGAVGGCLDIFTLLYPFSPLSPFLWETARYRLFFNHMIYMSQGESQVRIRYNWNFIEHRIITEQVFKQELVHFKKPRKQMQFSLHQCFWTVWCIYKQDHRVSGLSPASRPCFHAVQLLPPLELPMTFLQLIFFSVLWFLSDEIRKSR